MRVAEVFHVNIKFGKKDCVASLETSISTDCILLSLLGGL